jgi:hypothetical protein
VPKKYNIPKPQGQGLRFLLSEGSKKLKYRYDRSCLPVQKYFVACQHAQDMSYSLRRAKGKCVLFSLLFLFLKNLLIIIIFQITVFFLSTKNILPCSDVQLNYDLQFTSNNSKCQNNLKQHNNNNTNTPSTIYAHFFDP